MPLKPGYLLLIGAGGIAAYSGLKGKGLGATARQLISGQNPSGIPQTNPIWSTVAGGPTTQVGGGNTGLPYGTVGTAPPGNTGAQTGNAKANQAIARVLAAPYGWSFGQNWSDLVSLWNQESGWNNYADNAGSDAEGIPQSLPYSKMPRAAWLPKHGGSASASAQIAWGLNYIKQTYGNPSVAWAHEVANNWY